MCFVPVYEIHGGIEGYWGVCRHNILRIGYQVDGPQFSYSMFIISIVFLFAIVSVIIDRIEEEKPFIESKIVIYNFLMLSISVLMGLIDSINKTIRNIEPPDTLRTSAGVIHYPSTIITRGIGYYIVEALLFLVLWILLLTLLFFVMRTTYRLVDRPDRSG